ncbi:hypothetical protein [Heyndrickxia ginsengihumi]|uniref:hypothetical protein n=1 Tax=Heyndrickxia ginsengihumi TaxID=363870 RepID=UPI002040B899|nr:hypothetical protein [Heyndrickxia ginsengihumi]
MEPLIQKFEVKSCSSVIKHVATRFISTDQGTVSTLPVPVNIPLLNGAKIVDAECYFKVGETVPELLSLINHSIKKRLKLNQFGE